MNAPLWPERLVAGTSASGAAGDTAAQAELPLATPGVQRIVWDGRYGRMLIEVEDGRIRVNGRLVETIDSMPPG